MLLAPQYIIVYGVAHLLELAYCEAFGEVAYLVVIEESLGEVYS